MKCLKLILLLNLIALSSGCDNWYYSSVHIENKAGVSVKNITVKFSGDSEFIKKLDYGDDIYIKKNVKRAGVIEISYNIENKFYKKSLRYIETSFNNDCNVEILKTEMKFTCEHSGPVSFFI